MTIRFETLASRVAATLLAVLLTACANIDLRVPADTQVDAAKLGATPSPIDWPRDDWWTRYGDAQLDALVAEGLAGSPTLAAARARIAKRRRRRGRVARRAAAAGQRQRHRGVSALLGELHLPAAARRQRGRPTRGSTLDFSFEFDFWDKNGAALRSRVVAGAERRGRRARPRASH